MRSTRIARHRRSRSSMGHAPGNPSPRNTAMPATTEAPPGTSDRLTGGATLPRRWLWLMRLFRWYAHRYVRKHFHAVRVSNSGQPFPPTSDEPLLVVLNHPAWWDPMICLVLSRLMAERDQFAAIDAEAVRRYS